jgi:hypothetical protein
VGVNLNKNCNTKCGGVGFIIPIIASLITLALTHDIYVSAAILGIGIIFNILMWFSIIPVLGLLLQYWGAHSLYNYAITSAMISPDAIIVLDSVYWIFIAIGFIINAFVTIGILLAVKK